jgi:hypothetical protein
MKLSIKANATSQSVNLFVQDSTKTDGSGLGAVAPAGGSLLTGTKLYYSFTGSGAASVAVSLSVLATVGASYSSGGIVTIDDTNMKGLVRVDLPNAMIASGNGRVVSAVLFGGTNMAPVPFEIELTGWDNQDAVHGGLSALPNTACTTNASLITSGTGTDQLSVSSGIGQANVEQWDSVAIAEPATDGIPDVNIKNIVNVAAVLDANNLLKVDVEDWKGTVAVTPNTNGVPIVDTRLMTRVGTAQAGASTSITLDSGASATDSFYLGQEVTIISGTGAQQSGRVITAYVGSTKVATVSPNWTTAPDSSSVFALHGCGADIESTRQAASLGAAGYIGIDWGHVTAPTTAVNLANTTIGTLTTYTGNTPQTGDAFARLGAPAGASIAADLAEIEAETDGIANIPTAAQNATAIWQDVTAGDFTVAHSIGKALFIDNHVPGSSGGLLISGSNAGTTTFGAVTITGTFTVNDGIEVNRSTADTYAVIITGNGMGGALDLESGTTTFASHAVLINSNATNGAGILVQAAGASAGMQLFGGASGPGLSCVGYGTGGVGIVAAGVVNGMYCFASNGIGLNCYGSNGSGIYAYGNQVDAGFKIRGDLGANGLQIEGVSPADDIHLVNSTGNMPEYIAKGVWEDLLAGGDFGTVGSIGKLLADDIDAAISSRLATTGYTVPPTASAIVTALLTAIIEGTLTVEELLRVVLSSCALKTNGAGTAAFNCRDVADTKNRIAAVVDPAGNRTAVTIDGT